MESHKIKPTKPLKYNEIKSIQEISQEAKLLFPIIERNQYIMPKTVSSPSKKREDVRFPLIERKNHSISLKKNGPLKVNKSSELIEMSSLSAKNYLYKKPAFSKKYYISTII